MSVVFINPYAFGGGGVGPHRYWRITFTVTQSINQDLWINQLRGYEDRPGRGLNNLAGAVVTSNLSWAVGTQYVDAVNEWPTQDYVGFFDTSLNVPNNTQFNYDLGAGNEAAINYIDIRGGLVGGETPRDFTVSFSDDGSNYFTAWSSGAVTTYSAREEREFAIDPAPASAEGVLANRTRTFVVAGKPSAGQSVHRARTFVVGGKRDDGLVVTEATTYVVVTP